MARQAVAVLAVLALLALASLPGAQGVCATARRTPNAMQSARVYARTPTARAFHTSVTLRDHSGNGTNEFMVVFGGCSLSLVRDAKGIEAHALDDLWAFQYATRNWFNLPVAAGAIVPASRFGHSAAALNGGHRMIVFGGVRETTTVAAAMGEEGPFSCEPEDNLGPGGLLSNETWIFTPAGPSRSRSWSLVLVASGPSPRCGHAMAAADDLTVYLWGGLSWRTGSPGSAVVLSDLWRYDTASGWSQVPQSGPVPTPRFGMSLTPAPAPATAQGWWHPGRDAAPGALALFGGETSGGACLNDTWTLDLSSLAWTKVPTPNSPPPRRHHTAIVTSTGKLLVHAGLNCGSNALKDSFELSLAGGAWQPVEPWSLFVAQGLDYSAHASNVWGHTMMPYPSSVCSVDSLVLFGGLHETMSAAVNLPVGETQDFVLTEVTADSDAIVWRPNTEDAGPFSRSGHTVVTVSRSDMGLKNHTAQGCTCLHGCGNPGLRFSSNWCLVDPECPGARTDAAGQAWGFCGFSRLILVGGHFNLDRERTDLLDADGVVWEYDPVSSTWDQDVREDGTPVPQQRFDHAVALMQNRYSASLIVHGGVRFLQGSRTQVVDGDAWQYFPSFPGVSGRWQHVPAASPPPGVVVQRMGHIAVHWGGGLYVFGGATGPPCNATECDLEWHLVSGPQFVRLDLVAGAWRPVQPVGGSAASASAPGPRAYHKAALMYNGTEANTPLLLVFGGIGRNRTLLNELWVWDFIRERWSELTPSSPRHGPRPRFQHSLTALGTKLLLYGGQISRLSEAECDRQPAPCNLNDLWEYDIQLRRWSLLESTQPTCNDGILENCVAPNPSLRSHSSAVINDQLFVLGGYSSYVAVARVVGEATFSTATSSFLFHTTPACDAGAASEDYATLPCNLCLPGLFAATPGACACVECRGLTFSPLHGGTSQAGSCKSCRPSYCHYGECRLDDNDSPVCSCSLGYIPADRCRIPWLFVGPAILAVAIALLVWAVRKRLRYKQKRRLRKLQFAETRRQVEELERAWVIRPEDLSFHERIDEFSAGSQGEVWRASWGTTQVAVKKLKQNFLQFDRAGFTEQFDREVRFIRAIRHPHVVAFMGAGTLADEDGTPFIVTELMERGSLQEVLAKPANKIDLALKVRFALDAAKGMRFLHTTERIHRDLKTANLLVSSQWVVKVGDFGTSRLCALDGGTSRPEEHPSPRTRSRSWSPFKKRRKAAPPVYEDAPQIRVQAPDDGSDSGGSEQQALITPDPLMSGSTNSTSSYNSRPFMTQFVGTPVYQAPEVSSGSLTYGRECDVYSFGIVLWEILTRRQPFDTIANSVWGIRRAVEGGERPEVPDCIPDRIAAIVTQCWAQRPVDRPTFEAVVRDLDRILESPELADAC